MFRKDNIQPSVNPKPITVLRGYANSGAEGKGISGAVFIRNVSIDPRELMRTAYVVPQPKPLSLTNLAVFQQMMNE